ncbi:GGDEF domain-containing protein, partial [Acinetobacter baumannii]
KPLNDTYGHAAGDAILAQVVERARATLRPVDLFGRYGGEEFLLLLPNTEGGAAERMLDRLRAIVADLDWSAFAPGMRVTISA